MPGWVADDWIKWLTTIELSADEPKGFWYETGYRFPVTPGAPGQAVPPDQTKPMTKLFVKSLIGSVSPGDVIPPGTHELVGVAFSGEAKIKTVDVTVDGGTTWQPAKLDAHDSAYGFRLFRYAWNATAGKALALVAACKSHKSSEPSAQGSAAPAPPPAADAAVADQMELINAQCRICHSTQYLTQQRLPEAAWKKTIEKMRKFGCAARDEVISGVRARAERARAW